MSTASRISISFIEGQIAALDARVTALDSPAYLIIAVDYSIKEEDRFIEVTAPSKVMTLPAIPAAGTNYEVLNTSSGNVTIDTVDSALINGSASVEILSTEVRSSIKIACGNFFCAFNATS